MKIKKIFNYIILASLGLLAISSCGKQSDDILNYDTPKNDDEIAVLKIKDYGEIAFRMFPEQAPKAVENFIGLAKDNYYTGKSIHRVIENFMMQGGSPNGDGIGGTSIWDGEFAIEKPKNLYHFYGAVCYANNGRGNTCQFYIVNSNTPVTDDYVEMVKSYGYDAPTGKVLEKYKEVGGTFQLDGDYTVFGQVLSGFEVIDTIAKVKVGMNSNNTEKSVPIDEILIDSVTVMTYEEYLNK